MNVVGEIGNFIMIYQRPIQGAAIAILLIGGMVCIGKAFVHAGKKRKLMEQINQTVSEINANVKFLSDKKTEVIYIDGRVIPEARAVKDENIENANVVTDAQEEAQTETLEEAENADMSEDSLEKKSPTLKYVSRDCGISKDGHKYTIEELDAQIKD